MSLRDVTDAVKLREDLRRLALVDDLTDLFNRRGMLALAPKYLAHAERAGRGVLLLYADLDGLKAINDRFGHDAGDRALADFALVLRSTLRLCDLVSRIGGDEFAALVVDTPPEARRVVVARLRSRLAEQNAKQGRPFALSCSLGTARFDPAHPIPFEDLLRSADRAMYRSKARRHRVTNAVTRPD